MASKPKIRGPIVLALILPLMVSSVAQIAGLYTHIGAWNHRLGPGYEWCFLPVAKIEISKMQEGFSSSYYHPGPHIRWPGFEYVQVYHDCRIPWRANISTFYTVTLPIAALAILYGRFALRRTSSSTG